MPDRKAFSVKKLQTQKAMGQLMAEYYAQFENTSEAKVAWCTSVGPAELLRAMGFLVYFPENHSAMLGSQRLASQLIPAANAIGYSPDICSYLTSDIGAWLRNQSPLTQAFGMTGVPKPDVLVYNTNQCRDVQDWFAFYQRRFNVPLLGIHSPRCIGTLTQDQVDGVMAQIKAMVPTLEKVAGKRLDIDQLKQVIDSSYRCSFGWKQVLESAKHLPSPLTFFDGTIHMAPAVVLRGDERAVRYYDLLEKELKARIDEGVGAVDDERFRLYWEGMPVWGKLRENAQLLGSKHACVVASTYCHSWIFEDLAHPDPFEGMARAYTALFIVRDEAYKEAYLTRMVQDYGARGLIFHDAKTCPNNSNNRYGLPRRLREKLGIPHIVIHGDLNDLRLYSEEQTNTQFEAFIEQLE